MLIYEVNLQAEPDIADAYLDWLETHVGEMLRFDGFERAEVFTLDDEDGRRFTVHYRVRDEAALERYLREDAPHMRADGLNRFGDKFSANRRVLHLHRAFGG